jgi:hypothetical protein
MTQFTENLNIISGLTDSPVEDGTLTAEQFKAKFDAAANLIKTFLNSTLLVELAAAGNGVRASTADKLKTARTITIKDADETNSGASVSFDGSGNIVIKLPATLKAALTGNVTGNVAGNVNGNAATATKLATARGIGSASFDGSAAITLAQMGAMPSAGGAFTGGVTMKQIILTSESYGTELPASGTAGRLFFKKV